MAFPYYLDSTSRFFNPSCHGNMLFLGGSDAVYRGQGSLLRMGEASKRRPFFSSSEEFYDEDYYDQQLPEKKRRLTPEQLYLLEKCFEEENKLEPEQKIQLARKLGLQPRQVAVWFQNRRARWKTKQLERDYDELKFSFDSLAADYNFVVKENEKLKAEVLSLSEKLQTKETAGFELPAPNNEPNEHAINCDGQDVSADSRSKDHISTGSTGGSAVVDEDYKQLIDSGNSYFLDVGYSAGSEENGGSHNCQCFFSGAFMEAELQQHDEGETLNWWVWS